MQGRPGEQLRPRYHSQWTPLARALSATGDHWTLSIVLALAQDSQRPVRLQRQLAGISSGVLDRHLRQMVALGLLSRRRYKEMPPRVELALTEAGRELLPIAGALARWGMTHMWSAPEARERVDVEALLGLLPVLLTDARRLPDGTLELTVRDSEPASRRFAIAHGRLEESEAQTAPAANLAPSGASGTSVAAPAASVAPSGASLAAPDASVAGDTRAWIAGLGPERDYAGLRFSGHTELARRVLEALPVAPRPT